MYVTAVLMMLLVLPATCVSVEALRTSSASNILSLVGRWWVFWAIGVRFFVAGLRQILQPRFTAEEIFCIKDPRSFPLVREIGFGNISMGVLGIITLFHREFVVPAAIVGGLYYGLAGLGHIGQKSKNLKEWVAMISDFFVFFILSTFVTKSYYH